MTTVTHPLSLLCSSDVASGPEPQSLSLSILSNALGPIQFETILKTSQLSHDCLDTVAGASSASSYPHPQSAALQGVWQHITPSLLSPRGAVVEIK